MKNPILQALAQHSASELVLHSESSKRLDVNSEKKYGGARFWYEISLAHT